MGTYPSFIIERTGRERATVWVMGTIQFGNQWASLIRSGEVALLAGSRVANAALPLRLIMQLVSIDVVVHEAYATKNKANVVLFRRRRK